MVVVLDYFFNKHFKVQFPEDFSGELQHGDKISYLLEEKGQMKESIGTVLGYPLEIERVVQFVKKMNAEECGEFAKQQDFALKVFPLFKKKFKSLFPTSKPITARYNPIMDQIYFYFYSEERYVFWDFVREFKEEIGKNMFLFQVGARDMMRLDPNASHYAVASDCGMQVACQSYFPLPSVDVESIAMQGLEGRDIERLKWRCGKLKCSLLHELELYIKESKDFPQRWTRVKCPGSNENGIVSSYNIITKEVVLRTEEWGVLRVPLSLLQQVKIKTERK